MTSSLIVKIGLPQLYRRAVRRAFAGALPGVARARELPRVGDAFFGDDEWQRGQPMVIIGLAVGGVAGGLRLLDLVAERCRPFLPGEQAALVERQRQRERFRLPGFAEHRSVVIAGNARDRARRAQGGGVGGHAGSRYGSNASIETLSVGSEFSPHNSRPSNSTV